MTKTLADMTAEERANCVGMWADTTGQGLGVIVNATELSDCWVLFPEGGGSVATCRNQRVTPRFDLPRAWTPDGQPELAQALAEEAYEYSVQIKDHTGEWETATNIESHLEEWWESKKHAEWAMAEEQEFGEHCRIVRRRVSQPEVINE